MTNKGEQSHDRELTAYAGKENRLVKKEKLKILILTWEFPPNVIGGLARHCHGLGKSLVESGSEVHILTTKLLALSAEETMDGMTIHRVTPLQEQEPNFLTWIGGLNLALATRAFELEKLIGFDLIHAHDWLVGTAAVMLKKHLKLPLISTIHSTEHGRNHGVFTDMQSFIHNKEQQLIDEADQLIVCSDYMKNELQKVFSLTANSKDMNVIANGVSPPEKELAEIPLQGDIPYARNKRLVFSVGRIVREKGFETIIEAAPFLIDKYPDLYFIIAGRGPLLDEYRRIVFERGLQNDVYFVGYISDQQKNYLFQHCELTIFPSLYEPFGIVALEAMAFGKATIVSKTGGLAKIITDRKTGLHMLPGNKNSLIEQVSLLMEQPQLWQQLAINGRTHVLMNFNWGKIAEETFEVYKKSVKRFREPY